MTGPKHVLQPMSAGELRWSIYSISQSAPKGKQMFTVAFFIALSLSTLAALPGDWARRNSTPQIANRLNLANGIGMLAILALAAALGVEHGLGGILGLLSGIGTGQQLADGLANRKWGHVRTATN